MKRCLSIFLAILLILTCFLSAGAVGTDWLWKAQPKALRLRSADVTTLSVTFSNAQIPEIVTSLKKAFTKTIEASSNPQQEGYQLIAYLDAGFSASEVLQQKIYRKGDSIYLDGGDTFYTMSKDSWNVFVSTYAKGFHKYGNIPALWVGEQQLPTQTSEYRYLKTDGGYYKPNLNPIQPETPLIALHAGQAIPFSPSTPSADPQHRSSMNVSQYTVALLQDKTVRWSGTAEEFLDFVPKQASYTMTVKADYTSDYYSGSVTYYAKAQFSSTPVTFSVYGSNTYPGEMLILKASGIVKGQSIVVQSSLDYQPNFFRDSNGDYIAFYPISYRVKPQTYLLELSSGGQSQEFSITVQEKEFAVQHLTVDPNTAQETINSEAANQEYREIIHPLYNVADGSTYWGSKNFHWPTQGGRITTAYGMIRYVNGAPTTYRHDALDIALPQGTVVRATNDGRVLYAGFLKLTGNTVIIEHGYGLKSWYYHMNSLDITTKEMVQRGQRIGTVGSTGFSTGPHLHFGFTVEGTPVNPNSVLGSNIWSFYQNK